MQYTPAERPSSAALAQGVLTRGRKLMIVGGLVLLAFGYFSYTAFQSAQSFYLTVDELVELGPAAAGSVQVKGSLVQESFQREVETSTLARFRLSENGAQIEATYDGVLPDLFFNPHSEIVLGGIYEPEGVFVADRVYVKCPSKYQSLDVDNPYDAAPTV